NPSGPMRVDTDSLRQQHPIAELVSHYGVELRRSGSSLVGRCPFHLDRGRPNMAVYPPSGRVVCYRCGASGGVISFAQQRQHLTFREAASLLGANVNFAPPTSARRYTARPIRRARTPAPGDSAVMSAALDLYRGCLMADSRALQYLASRGFGRD